MRGQSGVYKLVHTIAKSFATPKYCFLFVLGEAFIIPSFER